MRGHGQTGIVRRRALGSEAASARAVGDQGWASSADPVRRAMATVAGRRVLPRDARALVVDVDLDIRVGIVAFILPHY
jgi:hypothetical protein